MAGKIKTSAEALDRMMGLVRTIDELQLRNLLGSIKQTLIEEEGFDDQEVMDFIKTIFDRA